MKVSEILTERSWIRFAFATNASGFSVAPEDIDACKWCLAGAIRRCYAGPPRTEAFIRVNEHLVNMYGFDQGAFSFNDTHTWKDIAEVIAATEI